MGDWYEENIEEPVRDLVMLLRDNGFNTECSCGHEMYIQCQLLDVEELERVINLLIENNFINFTIITVMCFSEGVRMSPSFTVHFPQPGEKLVEDGCVVRKSKDAEADEEEYRKINTLMMPILHSDDERNEFKKEIKEKRIRQATIDRLYSACKKDG